MLRTQIIVCLAATALFWPLAAKFMKYPGWSTAPQSTRITGYSVTMPTAANLDKIVMAKKTATKKSPAKKATASKETAVKKKAAKKTTKKAESADGSKEKESPVKKKKAPKKRARKAPKVIRLKAYWGVFNQSLRRIALFEFNEKKLAEKKAQDLSKSGKSPHFVQPVKEVIEDS